MMFRGIRFDLISARRALRADPAFTAVAVVTLAIGIGGATAMFAVVNAVLLRPLPVRDQASVVVLSMHERRNASSRLPILHGTFRDLRASGRTLSDVANVNMIGVSTWLVQDGDRTLPLNGALVSGNLFELLGVRPVLGRPLTAADDQPGAPNVAVLSQSAWRGEFGADPTVIGRPLRFFSRVYTIVGVMPDGVEFPRGAQFWAPIVAFDPSLLSNPTAGMLDLVGRLRPGATPDHAQAELTEIVRRAPSPGGADRTILARPLADVIVGDMRGRLIVLSLAVVLVLVIACGNVAMLMLGRGGARTRDVALRAALGAGAAQVVRPLLVESAMLAALGGVAGVFAAIVLLRALIVLAPAGLPRFDAVRVDGFTTLFAIGVSALTVVLSGLVPALTAVRMNTVDVLKAGGRSISGRRAVARRVLMAGQVAVALIVLVGASLLIRSLERLQTLDVGFYKDQLVLGRLMPKAGGDPSVAAYLTRFETLRERLVGIPGVVSATPLSEMPFGGAAGLDRPLVREGQDERSGAAPVVNVSIVSDDFFGIFGVPLRRGRVFAGADGLDAPRVAIVNETLARLVFAGEDPINRAVTLGSPNPALRVSRTVVGIVGDTRYREVTTVRPTLYLPMRQVTGSPAFFAVRTGAEPRSLLPAIRRAIDDSGAFRLGRLATMEELLAEPLARPRFSTFLLGTFAVIALTLVAVGVYSLLALFVRQRTRELSIRMALGATRATIHRLVVWEGLQVAFAGGAVGLAVTMLTTEALHALLFDVSPNDPLSLAGAAAFLLLIVALASFVPAWRAARVEPTVALRSE